jgi:hypothetical protein
MSNMETSQNLISTLEKAFSSEDRFQTMYKILSDLLAEGYDRETMYQELCEFKDVLDDIGRQHDADSIIDMLDCFVGWCGNWKL